MRTIIRDYQAAGNVPPTRCGHYPDCCDDTLKALQVMLNLGMASRLILHTPDEPETWTLADKLGGMPLVEQSRTCSHTCYRGVHDTLHSWGHCCGDCPACELCQRGRKAGGAGRK